MYSLFFLSAIFCLFTAQAFAGTVAFPPMTKEDRVLILAPHPDDEAIATSGVIQKALAAGAQVKIVMMTYGDNNEFAFIVYERRLVFRKKEFLRLGEVRRQESLAAMEYLGLEAADVVSLGYPDYGTMELFTRYWGEGVKPFRSMLSRVVAVPYQTAFAPGSAYLGDDLLRDLRKLILDFKPTRVFVSHPDDVNRDHRAYYLFTRVALWDLEGVLKTPRLFPYIIHLSGWPAPRGYYPDKPLDVPLALQNSDIEWNSLLLSKTETQHKRNAIEFYQSQLKYAPKYLPTFARANELFGDYPDVFLKKQMASEVEWTRVLTGDENITAKQAGRPDHIAGMYYALQGDILLVRLELKRSIINKELGVSIYLFGYRPGMSFSKMPKINLKVGVDGLAVYDQKKRISNKEIQMLSQGKNLIFKVPLSFLGSPDRLLSSAKTWMYDLTMDETAWRVLILKEASFGSSIPSER